jgi:hypothetical protein
MWSSMLKVGKRAVAAGGLVLVIGGAAPACKSNPPEQTAVSDRGGESATETNVAPIRCGTGDCTNDGNADEDGGT